MIQTIFGSPKPEARLLRAHEAGGHAHAREPERAHRRGRLLSAKKLTANTLDDLEATLIGADLGTATTARSAAKSCARRPTASRSANVDELKRLLKEELLAILTAANRQPVERVDGAAEVILVVGVNGTGKTTTIGKLAQTLRSEARPFCCALPIPFAPRPSSNWKSGADAPEPKSFDQAGGDPAAVLFDALQAAKAAAHGLRDRRYRRTPAHEDEPDGRAGKNAPHRATDHPRLSARSLAGDGRHHRPERAAAGAAVHRRSGA